MRTLHKLLATSAVAWAMSGTTALAQEADARNAGTQQGAEQTTTESGQREDIVVTAQKRVQTLIEVPQSVSVVGGELLERQQSKSFLDYAQLVPGLTVNQDNPGQSRLTLRGINTGSPGSTVAVYVDDAPFGASGSLSNGATLAGDFDTFDVARVEVLRGPQGTLYGANSLGGVLKFVTTAPALGKVEVRGQGGVEATKGGETGYLGNLVINLPVGETIAVRASGFYHKTGGYIDAIGLPDQDADGSESYGGRASVLFQPSDDFSIRLFGLLQNLRTDAPSSFSADPQTLKPIDPLTGRANGGQRLRYQRYPEFHNLDYRLYGGTLDYDFGFASLTSASSYSTQQLRQISDITTGVPGADGARGLASTIYFLSSGIPVGSLGLGYQNDVKVKKFTQEVRLASPDSDTFEWLIGGYYTHEKTDLFQRYLPFRLSDQTFIPRAISLPAGILGPNPVNVPEFVTAFIDAKYEEYAAFGSATVHFGPRFDLTLGGRYSHNDQSSNQVVNQLGAGTPLLGKSSEGVFTWSVAPRFEVNDRTAVYARVAKGYRPGGPNFVPPGGAGIVPAEFNSDTLVSYEAGIKAETADRSFGIDLTGFYVDWKNILILSSVTVPGVAAPVGVNANGRRARSYGVEATGTLRPTAGLTFVANLAYNNAYLRDDSTVAPGAPNPTGGLAGDDLPFTPRWTGNLSADYTWALSDRVEAFVGGDVSFRGDQRAGFSTTYRAAYGRQIVLDGYATVNLRAGFDLGGFTLSAYARNLTNTYGVVNASGYGYAVATAFGGTGPASPQILASTIRPRTVGATLGIKF